MKPGKVKRKSVKEIMRGVGGIAEVLPDVKLDTKEGEC